MSRKAHGSIVLFALVIACGCHRAEDPAYPIVSSLNRCDKEQFQEDLRKSEVIFVGKIKALQKGWFVPSGVIASYESVSIEVHEVLTGSKLPAIINVKWPVMGPGQVGLLQDSKGDLFKLDTRYFKEGRDFVIFASSDKNPAPESTVQNGKYVVYAAWDSVSNRTLIKQAIEKASTGSPAAQP